jgi:hypothetical protein
MAKKYYVSEKASFVHKGRHYKPGDEIAEDIFSATALAAAIKGEKLLTEAQFKALGEKKAEPPPPPATGQKSLDEMNLEELKAYAKEKNISVSGNKAEILAAIKAANSAPPPATGQKSLDEMTDDELKAYAKEKNISTKTGLLDLFNMSRADLLAAIREAKNKGGN